MLHYAAPLEEFSFLLHDVLNVDAVLSCLPDYSHVDGEAIAMVLEAGAVFATEQLLPLNQSGDTTGCRVDGGSVSTPPGFANAYQRFQQMGWPSLTVPRKAGGQGFPLVVGAMFDEVLSATNMAFSIYATVREGVLDCIETFGNEQVRAMFSAPLASGQWLGTMCLTEADAGSDLSLIRTTAEEQADASYLLTGSKIFISNGDHDLSENIVHLVLARTKGAPQGTAGLSLFAVPKFKISGEGARIGDWNRVSVASLEHKHGIRANATCGLAFDSAQAFLVGELNRGLPAMFVLMNRARLAVGAQSVGLADIAFQNATRYARERRQGRALSGPVEPEKPADSLISHIGVKQTLLAQKEFVEAGRLLVAWVGLLLDESRFHPDPDRRVASTMLAEFLTPVVKAYLSDQSGQQIRAALQLHGGFGYICETGMEQLLRDAAICPIYEGTNYIQSLDLLGRKTIFDQGKRVGLLAKSILALASRLDSCSELHELSAPLREYVGILKEVSERVTVEAVFDRNAVGLVAPLYLELVGAIVFAYLWAWMAEAANGAAQKIRWHQDKIETAVHYMRHSQESVRHLAAFLRVRLASATWIGEAQFIAE